MKIPQSILKVDEQQAAYWNGFLTRKEFQANVDPISNVTKMLIEDIHGNSGQDEKGQQVKPTQEGLISMLAKMDITIAFLMDKLGVTTEEFQVYMNQKMADFIAAQEAAKATAEAPAPGPTLVTP